MGDDSEKTIVWCVLRGLGSYWNCIVLLGDGNVKSRKKNK